MIPRPFRRLFRSPFRRGGLEAEVDEEHAFHLEEKTRSLTGRGLPPEEARRRAEADFGNRARWWREALRERRRGRGRMRRVEAGDGMLQDVVIAARQLLRRPAFTLVTVAVLALGMGFGVSALSVVDAVLYRPLPYENADRVVWLRGLFSGTDRWGVSPANWLDWKGMQRSFSVMAATRAVNASLMEGGAEYVGTLRVEAAFFRVLGVRPHLGRLLDTEDDQPGAPDVAVLTHQLWTTRFGADPALLGREITLGGRPTTVIGILPPSFTYRDQDNWGGPERHVFSNDVYLGDRTSRFPGGFFWPVALLREGITVKEAREDMDRVAAAVAEAYPGLLGSSADGGPLGIGVTPLRDAITRNVQGGVRLLGGFVLLLVLVVCVNAAGLLLVRTVDRHRELAIRASLGADAVRLSRETLAQVGLMTFLGGAAGLGLATLLLRVIHAVSPPYDIAFLDNARLDGRVALGAAALAAAMWVLAGVLPAVQAGRVDLNATLKSGGGVGPPARSSVGRAVIATQLALATALVTGAGILLRTYASMVAVDPGVRVEDVHVLQYRLPIERYAQPAGTLADYATTLPNDAFTEQVRSSRVSRVGSEARAFVDQAVTRLRAVPGVLAVAVTNEPPLSPSGYTVRAVDPDEHALESESGGRYWLRWVSPEYFEVLELRLLKGRTLDERDDGAAEPAMVVSEAFVETYLRTQSEPVGVVVPVAEAGWFPPRPFTVVGMVADVVDRNPSRTARAAVYIPIAQRGELWDQGQGFARDATFLILGDREAPPSERAIRQAISEVDPTLVIETSTTLEALYDSLTWDTRFWLTVLTAFGLVGLLLSAAGTFALMAQTVRHRTREIAIRRAVGATTRDVLGRVIGDAVALAAVGLVLGLGAAWYLSRLLAAHVVGVEGMELVPVVGVVCVLLAAAVAASSFPARWASKVDPVEVLRAE